mmetsp:Transcript_37504/g.44741  ORF Transcript_37504/g.44741 Transcript_37504/m.44741 type:complete len:373 (-) Transcript_37504:67-1185(-)
MVYHRTTLTILLTLPTTLITAFTTIGNSAFRTSTQLSASDSNALSPGDAVLLVGPGFLQLNTAKAAKAAGLRPVIVAPKKNVEAFSSYINDDDLIRDSTIGIPDPGEPFYGELAGLVFCAEEAILQPEIISTIIDWKDKDVFCEGGLKRIIACAPISTKINQEKSMGWMPIFNNDKGEKKVWENFVTAFKDHPAMNKMSKASLIRFGSLLGGSTDGPTELMSLGLDECIYKMSLENYRDLKERSFDRYRLGAQVLLGDATNVKPPKLEKMEKDAIKKGEVLEAYRCVGGYPEQDRANRHTIAHAVVQSLLRPVGEGGVPQEATVLSKCNPNLPTVEEWDQLFENPGPSKWPDPYSFVPEDYGIGIEVEGEKK